MRRKAWQLASRSRIDQKPAKFRGSLEAGLDARRTLTSCWSGAPKLYVRQDRRQKDPIDFTSAPIVWLFDPKAPDGGGLSWTYVCEDPQPNPYISALKYHANDKQHLYVDRDLQHETEGYRFVNLDNIRGMVTFVNLLEDLSEIQRALGSNAYKRMPRYIPVEQFSHGSGLRWWEHLLMIALNYSSKEVVCVLPVGFKLSDAVKAKAYQLGKVFIRVSLGRFSEDEQRRLRQAFHMSLPWEGAQSAAVIAQRTIDAYGTIMKRFWD